MRIFLSMEEDAAHSPRLSRPVTIDSDQLPADEAAELRRLVEAAGFFGLPANVGKPTPGLADCCQYNVTIKEDQRRHTIQASEPIEDADLRLLLAFLSAKVNASR
jgi:hypothetical protein